MSETRAFSKLGEALRWLRDRRALNQVEVAKRATFTASSLFWYESG